MQQNMVDKNRFAEMGKKQKMLEQFFFSFYYYCIQGSE